MEIDPFSFADALLGILAQRLIRTLCKQCKEAYHPDEKEFQDIVKLYGEEWWHRTGVKYSPEITLYRPKGCSDCANSGFRGRMGIHEMLVSSEVIKEQIQRKEMVTKIHEQAMKEGMETLMQDGLVKVLKGFTTLQQIKMVCMK